MDEFDINIDNLSDNALLEFIDRELDKDRVDIEENEQEKRDNYNKNNKNKNNKNRNNKNTVECYGCERINTIVYDFSQGIRVCTACGQVNDNIIDTNPEWRQYDDTGKSDTNRCSAPINPLLPQSSLGTTIAGHIRGKLQQLHMWNMMPYTERRLYNVLKCIQTYCRDNQILKCIEDDAQIMYKHINECTHDEGKFKGKHIIIRGKNRRSLIAACIYYACKRNNKIISIKQIALICNLDAPDISKGCKIFMDFMRLRKINIEIKSRCPEDYIKSYCTKLRLDKIYHGKALQIASNTRKLCIATTHSPNSIASACIFMTIMLNDLNITRKTLSITFEISDITIAKAYTDIKKYINILVNDDHTDRVMEYYKKERSVISLPSHLQIKYDEIKQIYFTNNKTDEIIENIIIEDIEIYDYIRCDIEYDNIIHYTEDINTSLYNNIEKTNELYRQIMYQYKDIH